MLEINKYNICVLLLLIFGCGKEAKKLEIIDNTFRNDSLADKPVIQKENLLELVNPFADSLIKYKDDEYIKYITQTDFEGVFFKIYDLVEFDNKFVKFYKNSSQNLEKAKWLLASDLPELNEQVICFSMSYLSLEEKLEFIDYVFGLFKEGKVSDYSLFSSISSVPIEKKPILYIEYRNPLVINKLTEISKYEDTDEYIKRYINKILNGKLYKLGVKNNWNWDR
ncbi:hypothetical protein [Aurantibacter aestuarii]|uniref:Lipoprotein n=1 Tax=Aurantibacter aestuarii TaxID=1266046 RepID=A0A2T1N8X2_9FLAO|nr:hypothetical protein [Aurantibacter aestuarii]PSG88309.1 hypothetical protein C7H52_08375 [Aurantibacter aestuarii]